MSNLFSGGTNLDDIFHPRGSLTPVAATNIQSGGVDLNQRYAGAAFGTSPVSNTNIQSAGTDLRLIFAANGSVPDVIFPSTISITSVTAFTDADAYVNIRTDGTLREVTNIEPAPGGIIQNWLNAGSASDYSVRVINLIDPTGGFTGSAGVNTWVGVTETRSWGVTVSPITSFEETTFTLQIAATANTSIIIDSSNVSIFTEAAG